MSAIRTISLRQVYDSRGSATVEAQITTESGATARVAAPSGASTGTHEVRAFPAGGVPEALSTFVTVLRPRLLGVEVRDQEAIDHLLHELDGTPSFSRIGGNTATAISVAVALAHSDETRRPLWEVVRRKDVDENRFPAIVGNCLNGGRHAIGGPDIQEFHAFAPGRTPEESVRAALAVHYEVGEALRRRFPRDALGRGDEGGWVARIGNVDAVELLADTCAKVRDELKLPVYPGLDLAASEFFHEGRYRYQEQTLDPAGQLRFIENLVEKFDLRYLEDPFDQEAFESFRDLTTSVGVRTMVVGDDLYTTSLPRLERGIGIHATNSVLIKVNQVGTLTDTIACVDRAREAGLSTVTSHRSGDVPEGWLAQLAVGFGSAGIKCGLLGGERVAKLNELLRLGGPAPGE